MAVKGRTTGLAELSAGQLPTLTAVRDLSVSELCPSFLEARKADLTKGSISSKQFDACKRAVALMDELYGTTLAADFRPKALDVLGDDSAAELLTQPKFVRAFAESMRSVWSEIETDVLRGESD